MNSRTRIQKKVPSQSTYTPVRNLYQTRSFGIQPKPSNSSSQQENVNLDEQYKQSQRLGHNLLNIPVNAPGTEPPPPIQTKLTIGQPGDKYEQEADNVAAQVVNKINSPTSEQSAQGQTVQRQETAPEEEEPVQAKSISDTIQRQEAAPEEEEQLQAKSISDTIQRQESAPEEEEPVQAKSTQMPSNLISSIAKESLQRIQHTVSPNPSVVIDIGTLNDNDCHLHLNRIGRINAGHPIEDDNKYQYDEGDRAAIKTRQAALLESRRVTLVNALVNQLAALGTATGHQVQPPWNGNNPDGQAGNEVAGANVEPMEAIIVGEWTAFLGAAPYSHKHPRTGAVDNTRLVSADGQRSIRYGKHERDSKASNHHFHQETWIYDVSTNRVTVNNTLRRASVR